MISIQVLGIVIIIIVLLIILCTLLPCLIMIVYFNTKHLKLIAYYVQGLVSNTFTYIILFPSQPFESLHYYSCYTNEKMGGLEGCQRPSSS